MRDSQGSLPPSLSVASGETALVGRARELAELRQGIDACADSGGAVLLLGEAGVGKTRLLAALGQELVSNRRLAYGRCTRDSARALEPLLQLAGLGELPHPGPQADPDLARARLFDAVTTALQALDAVVILDDLHWADSATLALLQYVLSSSHPGLTLIGAARAPDPDLGASWKATLDLLRTRAKVTIIALQGLDRRSTAELTSTWTDSPVPPRVATELHAHTGGNPYYLRTTLADLTARGELLDQDGRVREDAVAGAQAGAPGHVAATVMRRVDGLGAPASTLLGTAALLGEEFALVEAQAAAGLSREAAVSAVEVATEAGLLHDAPQRGRLAFDHAIVRQALIASLSPSRRAFLHGQIGEALESLPLVPGRLDALAHHFAETIAYGGAEKALRYTTRVAAEAAAGFAYLDAAAALEMALAALDELGDTPWRERYELLMALGSAQYRAGARDAAAASFSSAADLAELNGDGERLARAALGTGLERYLRSGGQPDLTEIAMLERALAQLGPADSSLRARVVCALALERCFVDPLPERVERIDAAIAMAERLGEPETMLEARVIRQVITWHPSRTPELLADVAELVALAHDQQRADLLMHLHCTAVGYALELGRAQELAWHLSQAEAVAAELRSPIQQFRVRGLKVTATLSLGDLAAAQSHLSEAAPEILAAEPTVGAQLLALWSFMVGRELGGLTELRPALLDVVASTPEWAPIRALASEVCARTGQLGDARTHLAVLGSEGFACVHDDFLWLGAVSMCATTAALTGDRGRAQALLEMLRPYADRVPVIGLAAFDVPVGQTLATLALLLGRPQEALSHLDLALESARRLGSRLLEAHALRLRGTSLLRLGREDEARVALREALDLADRCGATVLSAEARDELRQAGGRPRRARLAGVESLTDSERRVAQLAAAGLSNGEIAETLVVARRTVETHLTSVYRKLEISSREELAGAMARAEPALDEPSDPAAPG